MLVVAHRPTPFCVRGSTHPAPPSLPLPQRFWSTYVFFNFVGCIFCAILIFCVIRLSNKSSSDILAAALAGACFVMSSTCGTQCLLNVIHSHFAFGRTSCYVEAFFHLISIVNMFFVLALIAYDSHRTVVKGESMGIKRALWAVFGSWTLSALGIGLFSLDSSIYMAESGVFCFFAFDSSLMYGFFLPGFILSTGLMCFYYIKIFQITRTALKMMGQHLTLSEVRKRLQFKLAQKLFTFVIVFVVRTHTQRHIHHSRGTWFRATDVLCF